MNTSIGSETETEQSSSEKENDQPRQIEELVPKRGATFVAKMSDKTFDVEQKTTLSKLCRTSLPTTDSNTTNLLPPTQKPCHRESMESIYE